MTKHVGVKLTLIDPNLEQYATPKQWEYYCAWEETGSSHKAAKALGVSQSGVVRAAAALRKTAARRGYAPGNDFTHQTAPGFTIKRVSSYYKGKEGDPNQWVIQEQEKAAQAEKLKDFAEGLIETQAVKTKKPKGYASKDLLPSLIIGDAHIGMLAWRRETGGHDFDANTAVKDLIEAAEHLIAAAPPAENALLVDVGDFLHIDDFKSMTPNDTLLDSDSRYPRLLKMAGMVMRHIINRMLRKFKNVTVIIARGNHNPSSAVAVALMLDFFYDKEPRVTVLETAGTFHYMEFGNHLIGVNHGDKIKAARLVSLMARDKPKEWGRTKFRHWWVGHIHHKKAEEIDGCVVESFNTLAPRDAWHAANGYGAGQAMELITLHKEKGQHSRSIYNLPDKEDEQEDEQEE